jgi:hypothetical protein
MEDDGYDHSALDYLLNWSFRCFQMLVMLFYVLRLWQLVTYD